LTQAVSRRFKKTDESAAAALRRISTLLLPALV
jgi:hypothetical protein